MKTKYPNGWYDLMDGSRRVNRLSMNGKDARDRNKQRKEHNISARWVYGKQPGRPKKRTV